MIEAVFDSIRVSLVTQQRVALLKEVSGERHLPIWIGAFEADAIALEVQGIAAKRPLPYDLLKTIIFELGARIARIEVTELIDDVFHAKIVLDVNGRQLPIDSRSSDAIALAVRAKVPILVADSVMDRAGVTFGEEEEEEQPAEQPESVASTPVNEEKLSVFRDFINSLDIDDLGKGGKASG